jgi:hypothetical protein
MKKPWYLILSIVWIVFWILDVFLLVPESPMESMRLFVTDSVAFSIYWLWITAPISLYLVVIGLIKLTRWLKSTLMKSRSRV